eukprot:m.65062 g.65062  ORF g.65062 m.65062 type:complete len:126 (-) comp12044_c0_seq1:101-478(-)
MYPRITRSNNAQHMSSCSAKRVLATLDAKGTCLQPKHKLDQESFSLPTIPKPLNTLGYPCNKHKDCDGGQWCSSCHPARPSTHFGVCTALPTDGDKCGRGRCYFKRCAEGYRCAKKRCQAYGTQA